jgi:hypothetical protein
MNGIRTSTVFVANKNGLSVFRDPGELPASLRKELKRLVAAGKSATIVIADANGRQRLLEALENTRTFRDTHEPRPEPVRAGSKSAPRYWPLLEALVAALIVAAVCLIAFLSK